jgi:4-phospho-D-threonate 3-dehydrogenase / 4-phospho-D-erythronate 3-dehydrogenase
MRIGLTMGDPAGVGPEIVLRVINDTAITDRCHLIVFGDAAILRRCAQVTDQPFQAPVISLADWQRQADSLTRTCVIDCECMSADALTPGRVSAATGDASFRYIQLAIDAALAGHVAAVTTAPINKEALHAAGHNKYPGHTEMFAERAGGQRSCMLQYSPEITCSFVTVHCGYAEVPALLTQTRVLDVIELTASAVERLRGHKPKLVVCGLNPHAGEHGLFGNREEERIIIPAIEQARAAGIDIEGPLPPDTAFLPWKRQATDAFVCMYHDQGHIPVKALAFDSAVNTTLGISIIRTSVDHGTACDIAWQGKARVHSLHAALDVALRLASTR